jgi:hypothetical protein
MEQILEHACERISDFVVCFGKTRLEGPVRQVDTTTRSPRARRLSPPSFYIDLAVASIQRRQPRRRASSTTGLFTAVLTHYRTRLFGYCITYSASVTGSVDLQF